MPPANAFRPICQLQGKAELPFPDHIGQLKGKTVSDVAKYQKLLVGPIERFDQINTMFKRAVFDPVWVERSRVLYEPISAKNRAGYTQEDYALRIAAGYVKKVFSMGKESSSMAMMNAQESVEAEKTWSSTSQIDTSDPAKISRKIKIAARFFGASLVGICKLDRRWAYSRVINEITEEHIPLEMPEDFQYAVAIAIEMSHSHIQTSPTCGASAATHLGYSQIAFVAASLAEFIRELGYKAIPAANDSALSIPIAIEAGLGELGRNGLLITPKFGPRVRLCKVFTDLPLVPDEPLFFGVKEFCDKCKKCACECPSQAVSFGERTTEALNISNNPGVLKWPVNAEKCFKYWIANRTGCANCIRVCPFNKKAGWLHDVTRAIIKTTSWLNPLFVWLNDILRYGQQGAPERIWLLDR
jgi:reductive dehalogenase